MLLQAHKRESAGHRLLNTVRFVDPMDTRYSRKISLRCTANARMHACTRDEDLLLHRSFEITQGRHTNERAPLDTDRLPNKVRSVDPMDTHSLFSRFALRYAANARMHAACTGDQNR